MSVATSTTCAHIDLTTIDHPRVEYPQTIHRIHQHMDGSEGRNEHVDDIDYTRTCAVDILLYMTTFIKDKDARSFAHTSKSNLSALRRYECKGSIDIVRHLLKYSQSLDENGDDNDRSIFHPQFAFGQWNSIEIDGHCFKWLDEWLHQRSNKSTQMKLMGDYIQSREMIKSSSTSQSLSWFGPIPKSSLDTFKWLIQLLPLRPYELRCRCALWKDSASDEEVLVLRDMIPHWDEIQIFDMLEQVQIDDFIKSIYPLPSSLTELELGATPSKDDWSQIVLPSSLKKFTYFNDDQPTAKWPQMPTTLELLRLNGLGLSMKNYRLPSSLTELVVNFTPSRINDVFVLSLKGCQLPSTLKVLKFDGRYNLPVDALDELPISIETLELDSEFDQPVDQLRLPPLLQSLTFGASFDHSIDQLILPQSLTHLDLGHSFNHPIRGDIFPPHLKSLKFGEAFNQTIFDWNLPNSLTHIEFGYEFVGHISGLPTDFWPTSLTRLIWYQYPIKWIPLTSHLNYRPRAALYTPSTSDCSLSSSENDLDISTIDESEIHDPSHITTRLLKPVLDDRSGFRGYLRADGRKEVVEMLETIRQAESNW